MGTLYLGDINILIFHDGGDIVGEDMIALTVEQYR